jgi:hypothetical protein
MSNLDQGIPVVWKREGIGRDLRNLARYEQELEEWEQKAVAAYERVGVLRDLVDSLRAFHQITP